ncbi:uncharacterized protein LOC110425741 isoform X2 [Herrania umbratica]|uniref:Uncharacterized protein LOC110425741 isoform X2 n=1 Tax=Herrania umbratica TaxID=108875 RepID=A0A6J1BAQ9_9ROSI|nr:uncharacterized protein LOC110425741 isoform X2 [Herrania umbratica]
MGKQKEEEEEDNRREAAIASTLSLQPNFKPVGVSHQQLSKFRELHRRRLQIKAKSKIHKKPKDSQEADSNTKVEDSSVPNLKSRSEDDNPFAQQDNVVVQHAPKKRQKLHWGLDTKERWERKANM